MSNRADEVRKRIAKRKREHSFRDPNHMAKSVFQEDDNKEQNPFHTGSGEQNNEIHPLFRKEIFIFKILLSACLVLIVAILYRNQSAQFDSSRNFVQKSMSKEFQFTAMSEWYKDKFGEPLALLPQKEKNKTVAANNDEKFAIPANVKVLESFASNGQGIMIETPKSQAVKAVKEGNVMYAGKKDDLGKTVIIQHADGTETWYGHLQSISISVYDFVEKDKVIGKAMDAGDKTKGQYYFAVKKDDHFIDPVQVISFD